MALTPGGAREYNATLALQAPAATSTTNASGVVSSIDVGTHETPVAVWFCPRDGDYYAFPLLDPWGGVAHPDISDAWVAKGVLPHRWPTCLVTRSISRARAESPTYSGATLIANDQLLQATLWAPVSD